MSSVRMEWNGNRVEAIIQDATVDGLGKAAEHLLGESRRIVPIEEATLERSGVASVDPARMMSAVSFDTVYAVRQHEELTWRHDAGRSAKYLERPMHEQAPVIQQIIAAEVRKATAS